MSNFLLTLAGRSAGQPALPQARPYLMPVFMPPSLAIGPAAAYPPPVSLSFPAVAAPPTPTPHGAAAQSALPPEPVSPPPAPQSPPAVDTSPDADRPLRPLALEPTRAVRVEAPQPDDAGRPVKPPILPDVQNQQRVSPPLPTAPRITRPTWPHDALHPTPAIPSQPRVPAARAAEVPQRGESQVTGMEQVDRPPQPQSDQRPVQHASASVPSPLSPELRARPAVPAETQLLPLPMPARSNRTVSSPQPDAAPDREPVFRLGRPQPQTQAPLQPTVAAPRPRAAPMQPSTATLGSRAATPQPLSLEGSILQPAAPTIVEVAPRPFRPHVPTLAPLGVKRAQPAPPPPQPIPHPSQPGGASINVRIGTIELRVAPPASPPIRRTTRRAHGFEPFHHLRGYGGWEY